MLASGTIFSARGRSGGADPPNLNLGPPIISESTTARKLKLKLRLDMAKYLLWLQEFFRLGRLGGAVPPDVNLGPPIILETTRVRKLKLKALLEVVKYSLRVQNFFR